MTISAGQATTGPTRKHPQHFQKRPDRTKVPFVPLETQCTHRLSADPSRVTSQPVTCCVRPDSCNVVEIPGQDTIPTHSGCGHCLSLWAHRDLPGQARADGDQGGPGGGQRGPPGPDTVTAPHVTQPGPQRLHVLQASQGDGHQGAPPLAQPAAGL